MIASASEFDLDRFLAAERDLVEGALERAWQTMQPWLSDEVRAPVLHGVRTGGKRLRPILCVTAYRAITESKPPSSASSAPEEVYDLAVSVELIHAYSLMHDDLPCMDDAPLRRGQPTPHTVFGERTTMVAGAALIPGAALQAWTAGEALGLNDARRREVLRVLSRAAGLDGMVGGQGLDLLGEGTALGGEALDLLHARKTGALLTAALMIGGVAGQASPEELSALESYGREIGLAFQIADDILDATADAATLGKEPSDQALEKSTYVQLYGVDGARRRAEARSRAALRALTEAGIGSVALEGMARYVVRRDR